jgi:hypothetical protein
MKAGDTLSNGQTVEHFTSRTGFETEQEAREASRTEAIDLIQELERRGYTGFTPPPRPALAEIWDEFANCRIIIQYLLGFGPLHLQDKFVVQLDTLCFKKAQHD